MRAAILRDRAMVVDHVAELRPQPGQVLVEVVACGICGSDLHTVDHAHELARTAATAGIPTFDFDPDRDLVMGHEVSVRVLDAPEPAGGPANPAVRPDAVMAAMPHLLADGRHVVPGYDNTYPGGYCEQMLLSPDALIPVPNGLDPAIAALTEPMAVGLHSVNQSSAERGRAAVVVGAGPVGLAIIAALAQHGAEPIIATDFSPTRRSLAATMGAHVVIDPGSVPPGDGARQAGFALAIDAWAEHGGSAGGRPPVIFEAVGVPGMIDMAMTGAPANSELLVAGVCMEADSFRPIMGFYKRLTVRFVLGWTPDEFRQSLRHLAEGEIDAAPLITGHVDLDGVPAAFHDLADPEHHVKILVRPNGLG